MTGFFETLEARSREVGSRLCVGIDPRAGTAIEARDRSLALIAATVAVAAAFKPNAAFFEALGPAGMEALIEVVAAVPEGIPVILDAKRGDIASTAGAYAAAAFAVIGAGAITLSPYLGRDGVDPFLAHPGRGVWVLCRTSNPSAAAIQDEPLVSGGTVAEQVARIASGWAGPDRLGLVVGATVPDALAAVRRIAPEHWILAPGVGAQGASVEHIAPGLREDGSGVLVPVSRGIAEAVDPAAAAADLRDALAAVRVAGHRPRTLADRMFDAGCVQTGSFTLRSGVVSPLYLDLRRLGGHPGLLAATATAYASVVAGLPADQVGAVPYGALPLATAVALTARLPMLWPRPEVKEHGTSRAVEGDWSAGQQVVLVDDVATSGTSALEATERLRAAGLVVEHLVVLVERGPQARTALAEAGITLHAVTTVEMLAADLLASGRIDSATRDAIAALAS